MEVCLLHRAAKRQKVPSVRAFFGARGWKDLAEIEAERYRKFEDAKEDAGIIDIRFDLTKPLSTQMRRCENFLLRMQRDFNAKQLNARRPSRELWSIYLRVLDARDCSTSWTKIGAHFWPGREGDLKDKARRTYEQAVSVWDNFPA